MKKIITLLVIIGLLSSCATKDDVVYFNGMSSVDNSIGLDSYSPIYHINDELIIVVNALDAEAAKPFNKFSVNVSQDRLDSQGRPRVQTYRVFPNGNINFPVLGEIKLAGLSRAQATNLLQEKLSDYIKNPIVDIETVNYRITVLGEVARPGTYTAVN
ncbi:polysaccharide biosynthesis/export family protein, partial [Lutimonas sp.]|uniref:polysaccharide biosynthesis/export family protein n=1 Tax=Lutimonas sp. TaxID=1872403 RepID=UPI003C731FF5